MNNSEIAVIDYGVGNLLSVSKALEYCGAKVRIISKPEDLLSFSKVVLPGVGAFSYAMKELSNRGLDVAIKKIVNRGDTLLGICLGMQLLLDESEEFGVTKGLGLIPGRVIPIPIKFNNIEHKIPHIGWTEVLQSNNIHWSESCLKNTQNRSFFYFVHSYMALPDKKENLLAHSEDDGLLITAAIKKDNVTGLQFHPEKSGEFGLSILKDFIINDWHEWLEKNNFIANR